MDGWIDRDTYNMLAVPVEMKSSRMEKELVLSVDRQSQFLPQLDNHKREFNREKKSEGDVSSTFWNILEGRWIYPGS